MLHNHPHQGYKELSMSRRITMMNYSKTVLLISTIFMLSLPAISFSKTPEAKGFEIAARSDRSDNGYGDSKVKMTMILRNAAGDETTRSINFTTLERENEDVGDKSLVLFNTPRDIKGTALLSHAQILEADDQWLYLPALKRVKRISSSNKSGPFVGSEFAFEDFTATELKKFSYKFLREEPCGELTCDVLERIPLYEKSGYSKQISWIDQSIFQLRKLEFYDRRGQLLKVLEASDYREYLEGIWRSHKFIMKNVQTKKQTDLIWEDYQFSTGMTANAFEKGKLSRAR
jgi:hypothetical protein